MIWLAPFVALAVSAEAPDAETRTLQLELRDGDTVVAVPAVRVELGRPAAVSVGDYSLRLRMMRAGDGAPYVIRSSLYRAQGGWALVASPVLSVAEGGRAQASFSAGDGTELTLAVSVR